MVRVVNAERVASRPLPHTATELTSLARSQARACATAIINGEEPIVIAVAIQDAFERLIAAVEALAE